MRFEIHRLDQNQDPAADLLIADAATVRELIETAAKTGERLYIRPCPTV
ncbi:hypothetical protein P3T36_001551 [Kitasatospora sp. MAP12-15]|nr:hypothetical protein [Kitasatospora sp. MAP12-44]MDH6112670.1 hypothetical protein [Kitasatospora sp. MAP12-44]